MYDINFYPQFCFFSIGLFTPKQKMRDFFFSLQPTTITNEKNNCNKQQME